MPNPYIDNAERWLALADIDYLTQFVKAWIPFNAWYKNSYPSITRDRDIINEIKTNPNLFKDKIMALLLGTDNDAIKFKTNVASLYHFLNTHFIPSANNKISLESIVIERNPLTVNTKTIRRWIYKVELIYGTNANYNINTLVTNSTGTTQYSFNQTKFDLENLLSDVRNSSTLTASQCDALEQTYQEVNPQKPITLISETNRNSMQAGDIFLINDLDKLSKGLIEILYRLRNILFHGELIPSSDNKMVYEPAFYMLSTIIRSLK